MLKSLGKVLSVLTILIASLQARAQVSPVNLLEGLGYEPSPAQIAEEEGWLDDTPDPLPRGLPRVRIVIDKAQRTKSFSRKNGDTPQTMRVFVDGVFLYQFDVSTGTEQRGCPDPNDESTCHVKDTPTGTWRIQKNRRYVEYKSKTWNDASMPYAQFYNKGWAIHATIPEHYAKLGRRASGGCTRLHLDNAKIMYALVGQYGAQNSEITVFDSTVDPDPIDTMEDIVRANQPVPEATHSGGLPGIY